LILDSSGLPISSADNLKQMGRSTNYVSGSRGRRAGSMTTRKAGPNSAVVAELRVIQGRSQDASRNSPHIKNAHRQLVSHEIGSGIKPRFELKNPKLNDAITELWSQSCKELVSDGVGNFYAGLRLISRARNESGEVFIRRRRKQSRSSLAVPIQVQILESEMLDASYDDLLTNGNIVRAGVELNRSGERVAYHFFINHPDEKIGFSGLSNERVRVLAKDVIHHFIPTRNGQLRGVPINSASLFKNANLEQYDDYELERKKLKSAFTGTIETEAKWNDKGQQLDAITGQPITGDEETPDVSTTAGSITELAAGETLNLFDAEKGGEFYSDYMRQQLMSIASDHGIPYELMSGDWSQIKSDRLWRSAMNSFKREIGAIQDIYMVGQVCAQVQAWWTDAIVLHDRLTLPNYSTQRSEYLKCDWTPQGWAYEHPVQDLQAAKLGIEMGLTTVHSEARKRSGDAKSAQEENVLYRARQKELEDEHNLTEDVDKNESDSDSN